MPRHEQADEWWLSLSQAQLAADVQRSSSAEQANQLLGDYADELAAWAQQPSRSPSNLFQAGQLMLQIALQLEQPPLIEQAIKLIEQAAQLQPQSPEAWLTLGRAYLFAGQTDSARDALLRAKAILDKLYLDPAAQAASDQIRALLNELQPTSAETG
jgi:tetratricopeptide (TPR) repeat protein